MSIRTRKPGLVAASVMALGFLAVGSEARPLRAEDDAITVESLLRRMTNTRWLAEVPSADERSVQFSSYDRSTRLKDGKIIHPFANGDRGHYLRVEGEGNRREWVLAEANGPGFLSRIWSANPDGELRIYIDGEKSPALAAPFAAITNGEVAPFGAPFGHDASRGRNLYFPFPFARSVKVTTTKGDQYFHVNVTTLSKPIKVESYSPAVLARAADAIEQARQALLHPPEPALGRGALIGQAGGQVLPGQSHDPFPEALFKGRGGAITAFRFKVESPDLDDALARTLLAITFDGAEQPQVAVPLGDFFGSGPGLNPFDTAISSVRGEGTMIARWYMPFRKSARVRLTNFGGKPVKFYAELDLEPAPVGDPLHFHARWRYQDGLQTKKADGTLDWPALRVSRGAGRFVGLLVNIHNPVTGWWGEGDEKIYVDGESFPSTFGTGTEDYFGYAWGDNHPYMNPFHAQTRCDGPGSKGNNSNVRYHILDSVPFHKALGFDIEVWHWEPVKIQYATVAYFYAAPGTVAEPGAPELTGRKVYPRPTVHREPGVVEAESLKIRARTEGSTSVQDMGPFGDVWSGNQQLFWVGGKPGAKLELELPVKQAGTYSLSAAFTRAGDYGNVELALDGRPLGKAIPLYQPSPAVVHSGPVPLGDAELSAGNHTLSLTIKDRDPRSSNYFVGVDWIKLSPAIQGSFPARKR
ncbi:MAG: DUF2961 domain-containing protein [Isosphaeraceae bacterium]